MKFLQKSTFFQLKNHDSIGQQLQIWKNQFQTDDTTKLPFSAYVKLMQ